MDLDAMRRMRLSEPRRRRGVAEKGEAAFEIFVFRRRRGRHVKDTAVASGVATVEDDDAVPDAEREQQQQQRADNCIAMPCSDRTQPVRRSCIA